MASAGGSGGNKLVPQFLVKLFKMTNNPAHRDVIAWSDDGTAFWVSDISRVRLYFWKTAAEGGGSNVEGMRRKERERERKRDAWLGYVSPYERSSSPSLLLFFFLRLLMLRPFVGTVLSLLCACVCPFVCLSLCRRRF